MNSSVEVESFEQHIFQIIFHFSWSNPIKFKDVSTWFLDLVFFKCYLIYWFGEFIEIQRVDGIKPQVHGSTEVVIKKYRSDMEL